MLISVIVLLVAYVVIAVVVLGCASGRIAPNQIAGIRTPTITATERTWLVGHQAARVPTLIGVAAGAACAVVVFFVDAEQTKSLLTGVSVAVMLVGLLVGAAAGTKAARTVLAESDLH
ncbi:SdpI family protein [Arthrobacter sp.]|uniref:SdpI family protein n=1 Tax=Arthrobacter sp. TaxID=1667 RepID=UPI003A8D7113